MGTKKGRRKKIRYIQMMPKTMQFSPRGKPGRPDEIELKIDEYEAFKLADYQGYDQSEGAMAMGISRPSFGRILRNARRIIGDALVNGKIIRIRTSDVQVGVRQKDFPTKSPKAMDKASLREMIKEESLRRKIYRHDQGKRKYKKDI